MEVKQRNSDGSYLAIIHPEDTVIEKGKHKCPKCGKITFFDRNYYKLTTGICDANVYEGIQYHHICIKCCGDFYRNYLEIYKNDKTALKLTCRKVDIIFDDSNYSRAKTLVSNTTKNFTLFSAYMQQLTSIGRTKQFVQNGDSFDCSSYAEIDEAFSPEETKQRMTKAEKQIKVEVIKLVGRDVFEPYTEYDQKFLYTDLLPYLDEELLDDVFKLSQVLLIVINNHFIREFNSQLSTLKGTSEAIRNSDKIKGLINQIKELSKINNDIAKENEISVKNRGNKNAGKGTLTHHMREMRELGFDEAEVDYYDQNKAHGMKIVADISNQSILDQLKLDENDWNDILFTQRELIQTLQTKIEDVEERNRQLNIEIKEIKG